ncbi:membrane protein [Hoeflea sp. BAL378]|uniref:hypothetical protein n=1 Tax=Hoeflea sp. BAL378 TaxID=1547437 RepID=UPI000512F4A3|nr:hypothetical protein [Hoeflea sp. BAL378]KGF67021.1 membrane protein [Hoeflea sp. BAL378]
MAIRLAQFAAILLAALALVPSGAHLLELPNKMALSREAYVIVQGIYRGWALLGFVWIAALVANAVLAYLTRAQPWPSRLAALSAACFALMFAVFFTWTLPANQATQNWTAVPEAWESLRLSWEYSHAANAAIVFAAACCSVLSALCWRPAP